MVEGYEMVEGKEMVERKEMVEGKMLSARHISWEYSRYFSVNTFTFFKKT